jgi:type IV pilus assembly protein PilB
MSAQSGGPREPLGEILIREGSITRDQLQRGLARQREVGKRLGEALTDLGYVSDDEVVKALARQFALPHLSLASLSITPVPIHARLSPKYMREHKVFPVDVKDGVLTVAMTDPTDPYTLEDLRLSTGYAVSICLAKEREILEAIDQYYGEGQTSIEKIVKGYSEEDGGTASETSPQRPRSSSS